MCNYVNCSFMVHVWSVCPSVCTVNCALCFNRAVPEHHIWQKHVPFKLEFSPISCSRKWLPLSCSFTGFYLFSGKGKKPTVNKTSFKLHDVVLQNISVGRSYAGVSRCISFIDCFFTTWGQRNKHWCLSLKVIKQTNPSRRKEHWYKCKSHYWFSFILLIVFGSIAPPFLSLALSLSV